eukprot:CAMPEP_0174877566 /NCGR_PEP_ID=MMETSP1114-20130205/82125_1 /TAXON_ID=312471 /ORGANISM="Neobodo designis, Strain CCAP 1951/1" /LENGTH=104 /DNA_ID=CAMNT_0016112947 /DNA_START=9 /DNA_END=319 /DNA_ORIENTATION=+
MAMFSSEWAFDSRAAGSEELLQKTSFAKALDSSSARVPAKAQQALPATELYRHLVPAADYPRFFAGHPSLARQPSEDAFTESAAATTALEMLVTRQLRLTPLGA